MNEKEILYYFKNTSHRCDESIVSKYSAANPSCGDELTIKLEIEAGIIKQANYYAAACSVTIASAEFICRSIEGKDAKSIAIELLKEQMKQHFEIKESDQRAPCALLPIRALEVALREI